ncbi:MAG TPA: hypothetical protein VM389_03440 [Phycisphaerae bacterium]|nr:hypothetical protein [Phycisphaerae bacterium]
MAGGTDVRGQKIMVWVVGLALLAAILYVSSVPRRISRAAEGSGTPAERLNQAIRETEESLGR